MANLKKNFNRAEPNMPLIILLLAIAAILTMIFGTGLGPVSGSHLSKTHFIRRKRVHIGWMLLPAPTSTISRNSAARS